MFNWNKILQVSVALTMATSFMGCGTQSTIGTQTPPPPSTAQAPSISLPSVLPGAVPAAINNIASSLPPLSYLFQIKGGATTYTSPAFNTDSILKVTISSGSPGQVGTSGYTANYSCLQFNVTVGSNSQQVTLSYGNPPAGPCAGLPSSQTLDFSGQLTSGHGPLNVVITQAMYDNCSKAASGGYGINGSMITYFYPGWGIYYGGCTMTSVYSTHTVTGSLKVSTNMTQ